MNQNIGVVVFPGSNCEKDAMEALADLGATPLLLWHADSDLQGVDAVVIPGGFAHGDYLRPGAIARFSPAMEAIIDFAHNGGPVLGICNGFQVLTEAGLLPGALQKNAGLKFLCKEVELQVESTNSVLTNMTSKGQTLRIPINHFEGNFTCTDETLIELQSQDQIILTYRENPNGSMANIAGICNTTRNVVGLMPHPERACHTLLGSTDGRILLESFIQGAHAAV
ncbi:MAG: phosphoribosylformylglycinamidine synthase subunit PurQ [Acidimicrobiales bacterium]|nr:phosphoribosylformylglycinamidine synthase subunit PurQ [Acidimicrobiales bacterium]